MADSLPTQGPGVGRTRQPQPAYTIQRSHRQCRRGLVNEAYIIPEYFPLRPARLPERVGVFATHWRGAWREVCGSGPNDAQHRSELNDTSSIRAMASDHGELTRLVRLGPGMSAGVRNLKYVKADWELLAKIEGREFPHPGRIKVRAIRAPLERPPPAALTLETTVTVAADKLRGGSATPRSLMHSGLSELGRQPKVEMIKIEPNCMGPDVPNLTIDQNQQINRIGSPRLGSLLDHRLLTPRELQALAQASVTPRGYTASSLRGQRRGSHSARDASTRVGLLLPLGMLDGAEDWKIRSQSSSVSHRAGSDVPRTCAVHGATLRVTPGKVDYVLLARRRADYVGEQERITLPVVGEGGWKVPVSARG